MNMSDFGSNSRRYVIASALLLAACGGGGGDSGNTSGNLGQTPTPSPSTQAAIQQLVDAFAATLTGAQEVPPKPSGGTGSGSVVINPVTRQMTATVTTTAVAGNAAHIHQARPGANGPIVFPMIEAPAGSGIWTTSAILTEVQVNSMRAGEFYFNVHSPTFPDGEIRGQILTQLAANNATGGSGGTATGSTAGSTANTGTTTTGAGLVPGFTSTATFLSALRGSHAAGPTASTAHGSGTVLVNPATRQLTAAVTTTGIVGIEAHIQEGRPGASGPVVVPLAQSTPGSGVWTARVALSESQYSSLQAGNMYFNVISAAYPNGEIRGQILPQQITLQGVAGLTGNTGTTTTGGQPAPAANNTGGTSGTGGTGPGGAGTGSGTLGANGPGTSNVTPLPTPLTPTTGISGTGIGTTGVGSTGIGATGIGTTGIGTTGTGIGTTGTGIGTTGTGIGTTGTGVGTGTGIGTTGIGTSGTGLTGTGITGTGLTGTGLSGTGTTGTGLTGTGTTGSSLTGTGTTGSGTFGTPIGGTPTSGLRF